MRITIEGKHGIGKTLVAEAVRDMLVEQDWSVALFDDGEQPKAEDIALHQVVIVVEESQ